MSNSICLDCNTKYKDGTVHECRNKKVSKKGNLIISHGQVEHSVSDKDDCALCLVAQIELLEEFRKAGGKTKFIESEKGKL